MKRSLRYLLASAPLLFCGLAQARDLPNVNVYYTAKPAPALLPSTHGAPPATASSFDDRRGVPTFLWAARSTFSVPPASVSVSPEAAARRHLLQHASRYGLSPAAIQTAMVTQVHDTGHGGIIVVLRQKPLGYEVFHNDVKVLMDRQLELVAIGGNLHPAAVTTPKAPPFKLTMPDAVIAALEDLYGAGLSTTDLVDLKREQDVYRWYALAKTSTVQASQIRVIDGPRVKRVWFPLPDRLVPAYFVEVLARQGKQTRDAYAYVISAVDGSLLYRENLTHHDTFNYRVFADATGDHRPWDGPIADFTPHPTGTPDGSVPAFAAPNLISIDGFNKFKDPWLPTGATVSTGNNVDAYTDDDNPDGFSGPPDIRATTTSAGTFDRTYDVTQGPMVSDDQRMASLTDLFYVNNWLHDWWYDSGFDEAAGNAQQSNLGRGGIEGDVLHAEGQDGSGQGGNRDNSNMSAMGDGMSPRMQMYIWDGLASSTLGVSGLNQNLPNGTADFGPGTFDVTGTVVLADDGSPSVTDACQAITNNVSGQIVLADRGTCSFKTKAQNAQQAGAIGLIIANNQGTSANHLYDDPNVPMVDIPTLSVSQSDGNAIKAQLMNGSVTAHLHRDPTIDRDGTIDNSVIAHEWGHYIHLRQVACGSHACGAESEGWGDANALLMTVRQGDNLDGTYALAQYATASFADDPNYFGIRRYPYSVDMTKNPLTFKHIGSGVNLPSTAPIAQGNAGDNAEVHAAGEVWAMMLFESYVALLKQTQGASPPYDFDEAHRRMTDYLEGGFKMAPTDPTYTEQRDAILATAAAADPNDLVVLAQAFARRGAGTCAVSPARDSQDLTGVVESFTVQPNLAILSATLDDSVKSCDSDGHLDAEETGKLTIKVVNTGTAPLSNASASVTSKSADVVFPSGTTALFGDVAPFATATATVDVSLKPTVTKMENIDLAVTVDGSSTCAGMATLNTAPLVNFDEVKHSSTIDTVEADDTAWGLDGDGADQIWSRTEASPGNHVWTGIDFPSPSDTALRSPGLIVSATDDFVIKFDHRHAFEASPDMNGNTVYWDGAVIEVSSNGGQTWQDISKLADPGYGGTIGDPANQAMNVLKGRNGYVDQNPSYPMFDTVTINVGKQLAGKTVFVRFRIGTDDAQGNSGWDLDNLSFTGITNTPFSALIDDKSSCGLPPVANAGPDQTVESGQTVMLDGSMSYDPGSLPLTFTWSETTGAPVTIANGSSAKATFVAPGVTAPTKLTLKLSVSDGKGSASDTVDILVNPGKGTGGSTSGDLVASGGCGCFVSGDTTPGAAFGAPLLALAALMLKRRRRRS